MYKCQECNRRFRSTRSAEKASQDGCPGCGGVDIDLDNDPRTSLPARLHLSAINRLATEPMFWGFVLARHRKQLDITVEEQAIRLGLSLDGLATLAWCRVPKDATLTEDLDVVAARVGLTRDALWQVMQGG